MDALFDKFYAFFVLNREHAIRQTKPPYLASQANLASHANLATQANQAGQRNEAKRLSKPSKSIKPSKTLKQAKQRKTSPVSQANQTRKQASK